MTGIPGLHATLSPPVRRHAELLRLLDAQEGLLLAVAGGRRRDADLDREYWMRARAIRSALAEVGLHDPVPYRELGAWVAECHLRLRTPEAQRNAIRAHLATVRAALTAAG